MKKLPNIIIACATRDVAKASGAFRLPAAGAASRGGSIASAAWKSVKPRDPSQHRNST